MFGGVELVLEYNDPHHFYNKSYAKSCLLMGKKIILVLGSNYNHNNLPH